MAKAASWGIPDTEKRKLGGANGIRNPGSPSCKRWMLGVGRSNPACAEANALSIPPGNYERKLKTQRN